MKQFSEFVPVVCFFIAYRMTDIFTATGVLIGVAAVQMIIQKLLGKPISKMQLVSLGLVIVFGGITIAFRDEMFLKWKVSVVNWLFALAFLGTQFFGKTTLIERVFKGQEMALDTALLRKLNLSWAFFFVFVGVINVYVVYNFSTDTWVNFKVFGILGLTAVFAIGQAVFIGMKTKDLPEKAK